MNMRVYRMGEELVPESDMKKWHNDRGLPWGTPFEGPDQVTVSRQVMPSSITIHLANEHRIDPGSIPAERNHIEHAFAHMYGKFRSGQEHYHAGPEQLK